MVSTDDYGASKQMLSIFLKSKNDSKKLSTGNTIPSLGGRQSSTCIAYHVEFPTLFLLQNAPNAVSEASVSKTY